MVTDKACPSILSVTYLFKISFVYNLKIFRCVLKPFPYSTSSSFDFRLWEGQRAGTSKKIMVIKNFPQLVFWSEDLEIKFLCRLCLKLVTSRLFFCFKVP
jgi:hypothetical protein